MRRLLWVTVILAVTAAAAVPASASLSLGRDTVIVWEMTTKKSTYEFVVRLARFRPDRYFEWENPSSQGTVNLEERAIETGDRYIISSLFDVGVDVESRNSTTLWLSRKVFNQIKDNGRARVYLNGLKNEFQKLAEEDYMLAVNRRSSPARALKVKDDRNNEWWFLDDADNPILLEYKTEHFHQKIKSVTTDRKNTLRWIKVR